MKLSFLYLGQAYELDARSESGAYKLVVQGEQYEPKTLRSSENEFDIEINGDLQHVAWAKQGRRLWLHINGRTYELEKPLPGRGATIASGAGSLRAPMPGQVRKVFAQAGESVKAGAVLLVLEAMKMEIRIQAPADAKVAQVNVKEGQSIEKDQLLVELDNDR